MEYLVNDLDVDGIKLYPADFHSGENIALKLDGRARPVVERAAEMDVDTVTVHKSIPIRPLSRSAFDPATVDDIATAFPRPHFESSTSAFRFWKTRVDHRW